MVETGSPKDPPAAVTAQHHPSFLTTSPVVYPSVPPNWHLALLSQMRGFDGSLRPFLLPPILSGFPAPSLGLYPNRYLRLGLPQQVALPPSPLVPDTEGPPGVETQPSGTPRHCDVRGSEEEEEEDDEEEHRCHPESPPEYSSQPPPPKSSSSRGFSIAELLRASPQPPHTRARSPPRRLPPAVMPTCSFLLHPPTPGRRKADIGGHWYPGDPNLPFPEGARGDRASYLRHYDVRKSPVLDMGGLGKPYPPIRANHGSFPDFRPFHPDLGPVAMPETPRATEGSTPAGREGGSTPEDEEAQTRFDWLQCTRYRPPKLPRVRRRDVSARRKLGRNPRVPFTGAQLAALEARFRHTQYLSSCDVAEMSSVLCLTETRVKIWFQNRRARERRDREARAKELQTSAAPSTTTPSETGTYASSPSGLNRIPTLNASSGSAFSPVGISRPFSTPPTPTRFHDEATRLTTVTGNAQSSEEAANRGPSKHFGFAQSSKDSPTFLCPSRVAPLCHSPPSTTSGNSMTSQYSLETAPKQLDCNDSSTEFPTSSVIVSKRSDSISSSNDVTEANVIF